MGKPDAVGLIAAAVSPEITPDILRQAAAEITAQCNDAEAVFRRSFEARVKAQRANKRGGSWMNHVTGAYQDIGLCADLRYVFQFSLRGDNGPTWPKAAFQRMVAHRAAELRAERQELAAPFMDAAPQLDPDSAMLLAGYFQNKKANEANPNTNSEWATVTSIAVIGGGGGYKLSIASAVKITDCTFTGTGGVYVDNGKPGPKK